MKTKLLILTLLTAGLNFNTQAMGNETTTLDQAKKAQANIHFALKEFGLSNKEQCDLLKNHLDINDPQSTSRILIQLTQRHLSTKQAMDLMNGVYNQETVITLLISTNFLQSRRSI